VTTSHPPTPAAPFSSADLRRQIRAAVDPTGEQSALLDALAQTDRRAGSAAVSVRGPVSLKVRPAHIPAESGRVWS
jgi:hypothetical protein